MNAQIPDYISYPIIAAFAGPLGLIFPIIGGLFMLLVGPLTILLEYALTGLFVIDDTNVEVGFAFLWVMPKTAGAWLFYANAFACLGLVVAFAKHCLAKFQDEFAATHVLLTAFIFTHVVPFISMSIVGFFK